MLVSLWLCMIVVFALIETVSLDLTAIWFAFGAVIAMMFALCDVNIYIQVASFIIGTTVFMICLKPIAKKSLFKGIVKTNIDRIIGQEGVVLSKVGEFAGEVKVDGKIWSARSEEEIEEGQRVEILEIQGSKLIVRQN